MTARDGLLGRLAEGLGLGDEGLHFFGGDLDGAMLGKQKMDGLRMQLTLANQTIYDLARNAEHCGCFGDTHELILHTSHYNTSYTECTDSVDTLEQKGYNTLGTPRTLAQQEVYQGNALRPG